MTMIRTRFAMISVLAFTLSVAAFGDQPGGRGADPQALGWVEGTVKRVVDGDTIHLNTGRGRDLKVRMVSIDTAELHLVVDNQSHSQGWWAEEGAKSLQRLTPEGSRVKVYVSGKDTYGRALGRVHSLGGSDVNLEQVRNGWAALYLLCGGDACQPNFLETQKVPEYVAACEEAFSNQRGIFNARDPLPELPFLFRIRVQKRQFDKFVGNLETRELYAPDQYERVPYCQRLFFTDERMAIEMGFTPAR